MCLSRSSRKGSTANINCHWQGLPPCSQRWPRRTRYHRHSLRTLKVVLIVNPLQTTKQILRVSLHRTSVLLIRCQMKAVIAVQVHILRAVAQPLIHPYHPYPPLQATSRSHSLTPRSLTQRMTNRRGLILSISNSTPRYSVTHRKGWLSDHLVLPDLYTQPMMAVLQQHLRVPLVPEDPVEPAHARLPQVAEQAFI
jgi:hypothetical protein